MKRKLMKAGAMALAIALFAACGSGDEPRNSTDAETETSRTETSAAARTPEPMPTRPQRIDHLLTPTALPGAIKEKSAKTSKPEAKQAGGEPTSNGAEKAVTGDPKTIAELVPEDPRTNDQVLLQDIYAQINLEQFALDPDQQIPWQGSRYDEISPVSVMPHPMIHRHPYLHLFPNLETKVRRQEQKRDIEYSPYTPHSHRFKDISGMRNGLIYFIYNPWFEPVFPDNEYRTPDTDESADFTDSRYNYSGAGPYWFGNNSVRGVLAETVAKLLEEAKLPSTEPAQAPWFPKNFTITTGPLREPEMQKLTMEEFISTTISSEDGWRCSSEHRRRCEIMEESHITPWVEWEILHPQLPILKITAHADQTLPLAPAGLEKIGAGKMRERKQIDAMSTRYSVSFVISLQNRWASFDDPNRWIIRFKDNLYNTKPWKLDPELPYPNYWDDTGYMQHRIIGPVVLTVHEYGTKGWEIPVLKPGNYSGVPSITHWEAPGHILTDEQKRTVETEAWARKNPDQPALRVWPDMMTPNAGFPLPGHVLTGPVQGPGTEAWKKAWKKYGMEGYDW